MFTQSRQPASHTTLSDALPKGEITSSEVQTSWRRNDPDAQTSMNTNRTVRTSSAIITYSFKPSPHLIHHCRPRLSRALRPTFLA